MRLSTDTLALLASLGDREALRGLRWVGEQHDMYDGRDSVRVYYSRVGHAPGGLFRASRHV